MKNSLMKNENGSALPVGMILLLILTLLGVAGMNASRTELAMAGSLQNFEYAHQSAAAGLDLAMAANAPSTTLNAVGVPFQLPPTANDAATGTYDIQWQSQGPVPSGGNSMNEFVAHFFRARSTAQLTNSNINATHVQGFFVIAPGG